MSEHIRDTEDTDVCILCGAEFTNFFDRNNPWPLSTVGDCCGTCNQTKVVPERIRQFLNSQRDDTIDLVEDPYGRDDE